MKIPIAAQITEAELHRDALAKAVHDKPHLLPRLHRSEAMVLTLYAYQAFVADTEALTQRSKETR